MFYTYLWLREDGTPYYIGKGSGDRAYIKDSHRQSPPPMGRMVFYIAKDEAESFENEVALIWYYGRKDLGTGCLRNLTDGGDSPPKMFGKRSVEFGRKISASKMGHTVSKEARLKMRNAKLGIVPWNKGAKGMQVAWNKGLHTYGNNTGHVQSTEARNKNSASHKGKPWSQARRDAYTSTKEHIWVHPQEHGDSSHLSQVVRS